MIDIEMTIDSAAIADQQTDGEIEQHTVYDPDGERVLSPVNERIFAPKGE